MTPTIQGEKLAYALERLWGWPTKLARRAFPNFGDVHIVKPERIPPLPTLTLWHWCDPHGGRNWFFNWTGVDAAGVKWTFAEWPDGNVGEWAVPGPKHDGAEGPAQTYGGGKSFNDYKRLLHEIEGWSFADGVMQPGAKAWRVWDRKMDPRPANTSVPSDEDSRTYIQHLADPVCRNGAVVEPGVDYQAGCDCGVEEGIQWVNNWINDGWDANAPVTPLNMPKWYISSNCPNTIWALRTFTGADGQKGACKDPIDCLKGMSKTGIEHVARGQFGAYGGAFGY
jgi:hypothetical protein